MVQRAVSVGGQSLRGSRIPGGRVRALAGMMVACAGLASGAQAQVFAPRLSADINVNPVTSLGSTPGGAYGQHGIAPLGAGTVFSAYDREHGSELWYTDGTTSGTRLVLDIQEGSRSSQPAWMASLGSVVIFVAQRDGQGTELWKTDGTAGGTALVKELSPGPGSIIPQYCVTAGAYVYFFTASNLQLWRTDGTDEGTIALTVPYANVTSLVAVGNRVYFPASTSAEGSELWTSDGTVEGTHLVKDIVPGAGSSSVRAMTPVGDKLLFFPSTPEYGYEPWISDGTAAGTMLAKDIYPGAYSNFFDTAVAAGAKAYFPAQDPAHGWELWETNGTVAGTKLAIDIVPGEESSDVDQLSPLGSGVLFQAQVNGVRNAYYFGASGLVKLTNFSAADNFFVSDTLEVNGVGYFFAQIPSSPKNYGLWSTDGTLAGTQLLLADMKYVNLLASPVGTRAMLNLDIGGIGPEPWITDGTPAGTQLLRDIRTGPGESSPRLFTTSAGRLVFTADDGALGRELWRVDPGSTVTLAADLTPGSADTAFGDIVPFGERAIVWWSLPGKGFEPSLTDGTAAGTTFLGDAEPGGASSFATNYYNQLPTAIAGADRLFYIDAGGTGGRRNELIATNGTPAGTRFIDINPKPNAGSLTGGINGAIIGSTLVFAADDGTRGGELWKSDGTPAGTSLLKEFITGSAGGVSLVENRFISMGSYVLFGATDNVIGSELWRTDGTLAGTTLVKDIRPGSTGSLPNPIARIDNKAILLATTAAEGRELWVSDGTAAGTQLLAETIPGSTAGSIFDRPLVSGGKAFITISTPATGKELWVTDGTPAGTHLVLDIVPGPLGALTSGTLLAAAGGRVYFSADDGVHGLELWMSDGTAEGTRMVDDIWPGLPGASPVRGEVLGSTLYFNAYRPQEGDEVWSLKVCPADVDDSGFIDRDDFDAFVERFAAGEDEADFDGSGFVDEADFTEFVKAFETGC